MIHNQHAKAEIGDAVAWNVGCRYYIGRVHDKYPGGLILRLCAKYPGFDWAYFETHRAQVITADYVRRLTR